MTVIPELREELRRAANSALAPHGHASQVKARATRRRLWHKARRGGFPLLGVGAVLMCAGGAAAQLGVFDGPVYAPGRPLTAATEISSQLVQQYPALTTDAVEAPPQVRSLLPGPADGFDTAHARAIETSAGSGYVFSASGGGLCLAVPSEDPPSGGNWGVSCASASKLRSSGLRIGFETSGGERFVTALVPNGAKPMVKSDAGESPVAVNDGVVSVHLKRGQSLSIGADSGVEADVKNDAQP